MLIKTYKNAWMWHSNACVNFACITEKKIDLLLFSFLFGDNVMNTSVLLGEIWSVWKLGPFKYWVKRLYYKNINWMSML